jgi:hypothetical protein
MRGPYALHEGTEKHNNDTPPATRTNDLSFHLCAGIDQGTSSKAIEQVWYIGVRATNCSVPQQVQKG